MSQVPISTIVNVQISRQTQGVTKAGFGTPLILGVNGSFGGELVREYLDITEVLNDFTSSDDEYKAAAAIFAQTPTVEKVKIAIEGTRVAQVQTIVFSANIVTGNSIAATIDGVALTATPFNTSNAQTLTDLATKIQAEPGVSTAVSNGTDTITVTAQNAGVPVTIAGVLVTGGASQATATIATTTANVGVADFLADISEEDDDWYGLIWTERAEAQVAVAAAYIETVRKIFITCSADADILDDTDTDDIAYTLSGSNYDRTSVIFNADATDFADAAWMGKLFPFDPGSETWKFKTLSGITADILTSSERASAQGKNCNLYVTIGGIDMTEEGVMASGEYIDIIRGVDWLQARMEERIFSKLVNLPKVPFTDSGIAIIEAEIRAVLENGIREGLLSPDAEIIDSKGNPQVYLVSAPKAIDVSDVDKANRFLPNVTFKATLAGAIHKVTIQGVVSL